jgi:hypothetical protein
VDHRRRILSAGVAALGGERKKPLELLKCERERERPEREGTLQPA